MIGRDRKSSLQRKPPHTLEEMQSPEVIAQLLRKSYAITDDVFDSIINIVGERAALLILRAKAVGGDVRAIDVYLKRCDQAKAKRKRSNGIAVKKEEPAGDLFAEKSRSST